MAALYVLQNENEEPRLDSLNMTWREMPIREEPI